jgi:hypothetical protein
VPYHARTNGEVKGGRGDGERWKRRRQEKEGTLGVNDESFGNEQLWEKKGTMGVSDWKSGRNKNERWKGMMNVAGRSHLDRAKARGLQVSKLRVSPRKARPTRDGRNVILEEDTVRPPHDADTQYYY